MRRICLLSAVILSINIYGQKTSRLTLGLVFSPDYSYRTLTNRDATPGFAEARNSIENAKFGYTGGLQLSISRPSSLPLRFSAGIMYSAKGYQTDKIDLFVSPPDPVLPKSIQHIYDFKYIDLPLKVDFVLGKKSTKFIAGAGLTVNFLLEASQTTIREETNGSTTELKNATLGEVNKFNLSPTISFGLLSRLNENLYLSAEPTFRYGMLKLANGPIGEHLWTLGLCVGIHYVINK